MLNVEQVNADEMNHSSQLVLEEGHVGMMEMSPKQKKKNKAISRILEEEEDDFAGNSTQPLTISSSQPNTVGANSRQWQKDESHENLSGYTICVGITTRDESLPIYDTPTKMYSSLRYKLQYKCTVNVSQVPQSPKLLMCRVTVIDDETGKEIKKDNKPIIDDSLISLKSTGASGVISVFEANHKIKFKSVSFHHNKSKWRLSLQLFSDSNQNINTPVFIIKSAPFQVYARRPKVSERDSTNGLLNSSVPTTASSSTQKDDKKKKKKNDMKKRKRSTSMAGNTAPPKLEKQETPIAESSIASVKTEPSDEVKPEPEVPSVSTNSSKTEIKTSKQRKNKLMDNFKKTLDLLLKYHSEMDEEDKKSAFEMIQHRMYNHFYGELVQQQMQMMGSHEVVSPDNVECDTSNPASIDTETTLQSGSADELISTVEQFSNDEEHDAFFDMCDNDTNQQQCGSFEMEYLSGLILSDRGEFQPFL